MRLTKTFKNGECHTLRTCCALYYKKLSQYEDIDENPKKLAKIKKALEIIKNKAVDIKDIYKYADYSQYNYALLGVPFEFRLTPEEFDLLKEVLLWK